MPAAATQYFIVDEPGFIWTVDVTMMRVIPVAVFDFDDRGRVAGMTAQRYYNGESLEIWVIPASDWRTIHGIEMPVRGGTVWKLAAGDFDYYRWDILDVETNRTALWGERGKARASAE